MIKRGIINLGGPSPIFRISKYDRSADSTDPRDFLYREDFLYSQLLAVGTLVNPGVAPYQASTSFPFAIDVKSHIEFMVAKGAGMYFPSYYLYREGGDGTLYVPIIRFAVSGATLTVDFADTSVASANYVIFRL